jgi:hypothetical protein
MIAKKPVDSYDETKKMLNTIRKIQSAVKPKYGLLREQDDPTDQSFEGTQGMQDSVPSQDPSQNQSKEKQDIAVINDVNIQIHSEDPEDLQLGDEEKGKISQLIDDFRTEVSETVDFGTFNIYPTSAKLDGRISDVGLDFQLSTGDDTGFYIKGSMLKIDDTSLDIINKLKVFEAKYSNIINTLLVSRRNM